MRDIKYIAIHCADTKPSMDIGADIIRGWHISERKWSDIGYHFVIRRNGMIENGRPVDRAGAHVANYNSTSIGICMVGGMSETGKPENNFTDKQFATLYMFLKDLKATYKDAVIQGHRDFPNVNKECPCFDVKKWMAEYAG